jgi:hypothetical protein
MIAKAPYSVDRLLSLISAVAAEYPDYTWRVIDPQFIVFSSDEEHEIRQVFLGRGSSMYQLSDTELLSMLGSQELGFDWTDLVASQSSESRAILSIQCVDSAVLYALSDEEFVIGLLVTNGFQKLADTSLPFNMRTDDKLPME